MPKLWVRVFCLALFIASRTMARTAGALQRHPQSASVGPHVAVVAVSLDRSVFSGGVTALPAPEGRGGGVTARPALEGRGGGTCPVEPPCFCVSVTRASGGRAGQTGGQRVTCAERFNLRRRFPRFVEMKEAVDHLSLSYSGLTVIPNSAFRSIKVMSHSLNKNVVVIH